ncbi:Rv1355c family protein [Mycolicibacterium stellerae]|uniref:Rv1355c family protein n=1 Tax=Mycolicibacterium stellerae TaxID=2358193 RepID=UPI000F0B2634|nr:Rv1355c family protein [Mycolicibacterium stellerae]
MNQGFGEDHCSATLLDEGQPQNDRLLSQLRADPRIEFIDTWDEQHAELNRLRPPPDQEVVAEPKRWAYYPWRRTVASVLGPRAFRAVRLNRNRNLITAEEQARLGRLRVGVVGLSVGHAIAHILAQEGLCGQLRLADFDELELSNLNRVPATVFDLGSNKAQLAARRIAELDPYLPVEVFDQGITPESVDGFLDGLDILVEECDSLDTKVLIRQAARARHIPVLMATGDRGTLDVERFDLDPQRQVLHGLLGDVEFAELAGLPSEDKVPYALRMMDGAALSPRMAASLVEVGTTLATWPQVVAEVANSAALVAEAVRRIGLGEELASGRVRIDVARDLDEIHDTAASNPTHDSAQHSEFAPTHAVERVVAAAVRAPSGGNVQPWHISTRDNTVTIALAPEYSSTMDVGFRASAVAVGAAAFNARVAAAADSILGPVRMESGDDSCPVRAVLHLAGESDPDLAALYEPMLARETNRHHGKQVSPPDDVVERLHAVAHREGARLRLLTAPTDIAAAADILAESDRIRYLTHRLHTEMISEVRFPGDPSQDSGIDVVSLELIPADMVKLDVLRRPDVMAYLDEWNLGAALGSDTRERVMTSSCLAVVSMAGQALTDYVRAGSAVEAVWIVAQQHGLAVQPISPVFLYAHNDADLEELSPKRASALARLRSGFRELSAIEPDESVALVLRFADAPATSVRSQRRAVVASSLLA